MAAFAELVAAMNNTAMRTRVEGGVCVAASDFLESGTASIDERAWARSVLYDPESEGIKAWRYIVARNDDKTLTQILGADDRGTLSIQSQIAVVVPELVKAMAKQ